MRFQKLIQFSQGKYTNLLITLVFLFFISSLVTTRIGNLLIALCFLIANFNVIRTFSLSSQQIQLLQILATLGFVFDLIDYPDSPQMSDYLSIIAYIFYATFLIMAIFVIGRRIFSVHKVTPDILRGGICIYLLLGFIWFLFYRIAFLLDPGSFPQLTPESDNYNLSYFSFTTLTTLGYGDITPGNEFTMTLANAQAIVGQMYPAIFIARLVSLYSLAEEKNEDDC